LCGNVERSDEKGGEEGVTMEEGETVEERWRQEEKLTTAALNSSPTSSFHQCLGVIPFISSLYICVITSYTVTPF
jgi:hypothetical protein